MSKGILFKKTSILHFLIQAAYVAVLTGIFFWSDLSSSLGSKILLGLLLANLLVPFVLLVFMDADALKKAIGEPSDLEKYLMNKGDDKEFTEVCTQGEFWLMAVVSFTNIGIARMCYENSDTLALRDDATGEQLVQTYVTF